MKKNIFIIISVVIVLILLGIVFSIWSKNKQSEEIVIEGEEELEESLFPLAINLSKDKEIIFSDYVLKLKENTCSYDICGNFLVTISVSTKQGLWQDDLNFQSLREEDKFLNYKFYLDSVTSSQVLLIVDVL